MAELVGKLTAKSIGWNRAALGAATEHNTQPIKIGTIVGIVNGLKQTVNDETGDVQTGLKGNFRGLSTKNEQVDTGKTDANKAPIFTDKLDADGKPVPIVVTSGVCYLPGGIQEMIEGAYAQAREKDAKATVQFAIDLYTVKDTNKAGYTFRATTLVEAKSADPLDMLMSQATGALALAAPEPEAEAAKK
jgi:hypothetical protein